MDCTWNARVNYFIGATDMVVIEATSYIPALVWMDSYQPEHLVMQLPILLVGIIFYGAMLTLAYRISAMRYEKVDL